MQFDSSGFNTNFKVMKQKYAVAGYQLPKVIFWQLNGVAGNSPVQFDEKGVALVSGFSPAIMKAILSGRNVTPYDIMRQTVDADRYARVRC